MNFEKAKNSYRKNAIVQKKMAENLIEAFLKICPKEYEKIFEIGAGTGFLTDEIKNNLNYKELILNDITDNFTGYDFYKFIKGDILEVDIPKDIDLIASNACIQWIEDYEKLFLKIYSSLNKGGIFAFSTFGNKNFTQIKNITGIGLNYPNLDKIIKKEGFEILYFEEELQILYFEKPVDILEHIKLTGVKSENRVWTKKDFSIFQKKYLEKFEDELGLELTYHPVYYIIKKP